MSKERRRAERFNTPSIPVQLSDIDGELIDLSQHGAAVLHRSPIKAGTPVTMVFPSYGGIYVPCQVLRSIVQVRRSGPSPEYIFRSAISFLPMEEEQQLPLREFLSVQMARLQKERDAHPTVRSTGLHPPNLFL